MYAKAAECHMEASRTGNYRIANPQHDIIAGCYRELRSRGPDAQKELLTLLDHPTHSVRLWAAGHALEFSPETAKKVLEELEMDDGLVGFTAHWTLREFREGKLHFP